MTFYFRCTQCNFVFSGTPEQGTIECGSAVCTRRGWVEFILFGYYIKHHAEFVRKM